LPVRRWEKLFDMVDSLDIKRYVTQVSEDVFVIRQPIGLITTTIVVLVGEELAIVDTGLGDSAQSLIFPFLKQIGREPKDIKMVVNTHCHFDHIGGNKDILEASSAELAAHRADAPWIEDIARQRREIWERFGELHPIPEIPKEKELGCPVKRVLKGGEKLKLGNREFEVIHFPGHSPGCICLYDEAGGLLISGDSIQGQGHRAAPCPMVSDLKGYAEALKLISTRRIMCLVAGHQFMPFGSSPILEGKEAMQLVAESARTISRYIIAAENFFKERSDGATLAELRDFLSERFARGEKTLGGLFTTEAILHNLEEKKVVVKCAESDKWRKR